MSPKLTLSIQVFGLLFSIALAVALAHFNVTGIPWAIAFSILSFIAISLFTLTLGTLLWPKPLRKVRKRASQAYLRAKVHPVLGYTYNEITKHLNDDFRRISGGSFVDERASIPELSISTVRALKSSAFATYIADSRESVYMEPSGERYLGAWYEKAASQKIKLDLCRIFILEDVTSPTTATIHIIEDHLNRGVEIKIIEKSRAEHLAKDCCMDFAIFDETCLMTVSGEKSNLQTRLSLFYRSHQFP